MTGPHVLLVEDEQALVSVLMPVLRAAGYFVTTSSTGAGAIACAGEIAPDIILLDLGLPDLDGKEVIRCVRHKADVPVIVISARHQGAEKIAALDEGADDYVDKPFEIGELMARIRASLRRRQADLTDNKIYRNGGLSIDYARRFVEVDGEHVRLSPKEYDLLLTLARSAGQVVTHRRLLAAGWGVGTTDTQYLRVYIGLLRQKIEVDASDPKLLLTEPGVGYLLAGPAR
jgi:two-component system, OmpR family, KDP operon response regulator KdpE